MVGGVGSAFIRKHELTRTDKEDDRTRHILTLDAHAESVILTVRDTLALGHLLGDLAEAEPRYAFTDPGGVTHRVWHVADPRPFVHAFEGIPCAYVADGHHRCAGAWRAAAERRAANPAHRGDEEYTWFPAVIFPASQLHVLPYHRVVRDLNGRTATEFLTQLGSVGRVLPCPDPSALPPGSIGAYVGGQWHLVAFDPAS